MRVYRQTYIANGKTQKAHKWYLDFYVDGKRHRLPGFAGQRLSEQCGAKIQDLINIKAGGETPSPDMQKWIDALPSRILTKLIGWGIVTGQRAAAGKLLSEHVTAFETSLKAKCFVDRHIQLVISRVKKIFELCKFKTYADISYSRVEAELADLRRDKVITDDAGNKTIERGISAKTSNDYIQAVKQFCKWMMKDKRAAINPLEPLEKQGTQNDRRHTRRAMTLEEIGYLLGWLENKAGKKCGLTGGDRALIYRLALTTGLRKSEIEALTVDCIDFQGKSLTLAGAYTKNRQAANLPLKEDVCEALKRFVAGKLQGAKVFRLPEKASRLIKLDMTGARDHWLKQAEKNPEEHKRREESDFLKDITDEGLIDFHSLRHTFGTMLAKSGAHPKTAQALMRHSTIALTMDRYTHSIREAETAAIADLPAFPAIMETMLATGTDTGNISAANYVDYLAGESGLLTNNADYSGLKQGGAKSAKTSLFTGKTGLLAQKGNCACRDSNPEPSVPKTDALSN